MSNNLKKIAIFSAIAGAAAAGTYYLLQKNEAVKNQDEIDDDFDDFDDFDDENEVKQKRSYVSIDLDGAKEIVSENVIKAIDKTKEIITDFNVPEKIDKAKSFVEELTMSKEKESEKPEYTTVCEGADVKSEEIDTDSEIEKDFDEDFIDDRADSEDFEFSDDK